MSSVCAPVLEALTKASDSPSPELELWATSSGTPSPKPCSWHGWKRRPWSQHLFSQTFAGLTAEVGVDAWTSWLRATRASPSQLLGVEREKKTPDTSGPRSSGWFAKWAQGTWSARMSEGTFPWASTEFSPTLPKRGSMLNGRLFERPTPERPTAASDCSSWPTAQASDFKGPNRSGGTGTSTHMLASVADRWPTRDANVMNDGEDPETFMARKKHHAEKSENPTRAGIPLTIRALMWPTATSGDAKASGSRTSKGNNAHDGTSLTDAAIGKLNSRRQWPTPGARDYKGENSEEHCSTNGTGRKHMDQPPNFVAHGAWNGPSSGPPAPTGTGPASPSGATRRLNPCFVEWLMGLPPFWTLPASLESIDCAASETPSSPRRRHLPSGSSSQGAQSDE